MQPNYSNPQLAKTYVSDSSFKQLMDGNHRRYEQKLQQSYYSDLSKVDKQMLQVSEQNVNVNNSNGSKIYTEKKKALYFYSHYQPQSQNLLNKFFLYFLHVFSQPKQPYYLIYVNSSQTGKSKYWSSFKTTILQELPLNYLLYMQKLVLIRASFRDKASSLVHFGAQNKFLNNKCQKYDCLKEYFDAMGMKFSQMKKYIPIQVIQQQSEVIKPIFTSSLICKINGNRTSMQAPSQQNMLQSKKSQQNKHKEHRKGLQNYPTGQLGVPLAVQLLMFYFTQIPERCQTQGIFRKCSSIDDQKQLVEQLQNQNYQILTQIQNDIAVASALKRFIAKLESPIVPFQNYDRLVQDHSLESITQQVHSFPIVNFMTLMHLLKFLRQNVIPHSNKNLMTAENVSICFAPCLMRSRQITPKQFVLATINVQITKIMIDKFQQIFGNQQQQRRVSRRTYKIFRKNSKKVLDQIVHPPQIMSHNPHHRNVRAPSFGCPQDFLRPIATILQSSTRQSVSVKNSSIRSQHQHEGLPKLHEKTLQHQVSLIMPEKTRSGIVKVQETNHLGNDVRKHKSWRDLHSSKGIVQDKQLSQKSDCDRIQIGQQQFAHIPTQNESKTLNEMRTNRSRLGDRRG